MHRLIILLLVFWSSLATLTAQEAERQMGADWLHRKGATNVRLTLTLHNDDFYLFNDAASGYFVLVASKKYWHRLEGNPVLAYSLESGLPRQADTEVSHLQLFHQYGVQLQRLLLGEPLWHRHRGPQVAPLLDGIRLGQGEPYNARHPLIDGRRALVGCVSVALGQLMVYHQTQRQIDVTLLLRQLGDALGAQYGVERTSTNLADVRRVLCLGYGYTPGLLTLQDTEARMLSVLISEVEARRPCVLTSYDHAFICDGVDGDYLHYNLGWNGFCNGFYRPILTQPHTLGPSELTMLQGLVARIVPASQPLRRTIRLTQPGTLASLLTLPEQRSITHLTVSGPLNSADIRVLRRMAGVIDDFSVTPEGLVLTGQLTELDMHDARFVEDDEALYVDHDPHGEWTSWQELDGRRVNERTFTIPGMSEAQWQQFCLLFHQRQGCRFYDRLPDGSYCIRYTAWPGVVASFTFEKCNSLRRLILPADIRTIEGCAVVNCELLQEVQMPASVESVGDQAFAFCGALTRVSGGAPSVRWGHNVFEGCKKLRW